MRAAGRHGGAVVTWDDVDADAPAAAGRWIRRRGPAGGGLWGRPGPGGVPRIALNPGAQGGR